MIDAYKTWFYLIQTCLMNVIVDLFDLYTFICYITSEAQFGVLSKETVSYHMIQYNQIPHISHKWHIVTLKRRIVRTQIKQNS